MTTGRRVGIVAAAVVVFIGARSFVLPSGAPAWLRGTSPFTWPETRRERERCLAFGRMMGPTGHTFADYGDDRTSPVEVEIDRTLRVGDSLVFEGNAHRGRTTQILFHCATANVRGHPGEHHTDMNQPWSDVPETWAAVHALEAGYEADCARMAAEAFPTARVSPDMLVLRPVHFQANIVGMARDTVYEAEPREFACHVYAGGRGPQVIFDSMPPRRDQPAP